MLLMKKPHVIHYENITVYHTAINDWCYIHTSIKCLNREQIYVHPSCIVTCTRTYLHEITQSNVIVEYVRQVDRTRR